MLDMSATPIASTADSIQLVAKPSPNVDSRLVTPTDSSDLYESSMKLPMKHPHFTSLSVLNIGTIISIREGALAAFFFSVRANCPAGVCNQRMAYRESECLKHLHI